MGQVKRFPFGKGQVLALDTAVLIYFLEHHPIYYSAARTIFKRIEEGFCTGIMSSLVFAELLVPAYQAKEADKAHRLVDLLSNYPNLEIIPVCSAISAKAAELRADYSVRTPDAIHAATAIMNNADCIVTNDKGFSMLKDEIKVTFIST